MRSYINLTTLLLLLFSISSVFCLVELPSFPVAPEELEKSHNQFIVQFVSTEEQTNKQSILLDMNDDINVVNEIPSRNIGVLKFPSTESAERWRKNNSKDIKYFQEDTILYINRLVPLHDQQKIQMAETTPYGIEYVKALNVQDDNSSTRKVCIVDSGYDMSHPDLPNNPAIISGQSFVPGYNWDTDENSHGTHVAGTIMALGGNGMGVKGVIRNGLLKAHISKVFDASGSTFTSTVIAGFESCVKAGSNVINMSLAGGRFNQVFADAIADAYELGVLTFAAAGNSGDSTVSYPASYPFVTSVASITNKYSRSYFSAFNDKVDLCAPGSDILSTIPGGLYKSHSGTSMACPHVAGVAALVWSHYPELHHDTLRKILEETAIDLPLGRNDGYDVEFGHGLVNALTALEAVLASVPIVSPVPTSAPSAIPSHAPSAIPSHAPSAIPSHAPSAIPSHAPSAIPSDAPSATPSLPVVPSKGCPDGVEVSSISTSDSEHPSFKPTMKPSSCKSFMRHPIGIMLIGLLLVQVHLLL